MKKKYYLQIQHNSYKNFNVIFFTEIDQTFLNLYGTTNDPK